MTLGDIIKSYREEHQLSMDAFARLSGISKAYISLLEKNKHPKTGKQITPSIRFIKQAALAMNIDFDELFSMIDGDVSLEADIPIRPIMDISDCEFSIIKKYRTLDEYGKKNVDNVLDNEYTRCSDSKITFLREPEAIYQVNTLAAHERAGATEEEKQADYDLLKKYINRSENNE